MNTVAARRAVIVMAKRPVAGNTKTRLTPALSPQQAADMYERLLLDTCLLYTSPSPRDATLSRMPSSA